VAAGALVVWLVAAAVLPDGAPLGVVLLGVVIGSLNALTALGLVLVYRAARIINFAQAEIGGLAAGVVTVAVAGLDVPYFAALGLGLVAALATGFLIDATVVRRFFTAPRLILMVATLGVAQLLGALQIALPTWFTNLDLFESVQSPLTASVQIGPIVFTGDHLVAVVAVPIVLIALRIFLTRSRIGVAVQAAADSNERALLLGIPVRKLSRITWMVSAGLSGIGAMLSAPILGTNLGAVAGPQALLVPIAAAVIARMHNLGVAVAAALALGVFRQIFFWNSPRSSTVDVAMFVIVLAALLLQRRGYERVSGADLGAYTALRDVRPIPRVLAVLPEVRLPRHALAFAGAALAVAVPARLSGSQLAFTTSLVILSILAVSLVVLTGWAGQVSLGQFALAGVGGAATAALLVDRGADLLVALAVAMVVAGAAAVAVGLPALRIPGMFFAVTTLALSVPVATWLLNPTYFENLTPSSIIRPNLLERYELDSPLRWYYLCLAALGGALVVVRRFRGTRPGRAVVAARDNERAAAAFSISPNRIRLVAFALSGMLAGLAGGLYVVTLRSVPFNGFSPNASIELFTMVVIGGLGSLPGAILGAAYVWSAQFFLQGATQLLATGAGLLLLLMFVPGGLGQLVFNVRDRYLRWVADRHDLEITGIAAHAAFEPEIASEEPTAVPLVLVQGDRSTGPALLSCKGIGAAYGKVPVLFGVNLDVTEAEVVALLGTNGAGKSTVLRVVSGLLPATAGSVTFDGVDITGLDPVQRVELGLVTVPGGRGIFGSLTVADNLRVAEWTQYRDREFIDQTRRQIFELFPNLGRLLDERAASLSGGEQQMLTIAQAMLCRPRLLIIDELSLGLAPTVVANLIDVVAQLAAQGTTMIVVEQSVNVATTIAERAVFMERGQVRFTGATAELAGRADLLRSVFFGSALGQPATPRRAAREQVDGPALEAVGITMRFGGVTALHDASFQVAAHEILGIIGSNGAGKTTVFDVCTGFLAPTSGRIRLAGTDVTDMSAAARAELGMGRVFQDARLFPGLTVTETIAVALERHIAVRDPIACSLGLSAAQRSEHNVSERVEALIGTMGLDRYRNAFTAELSTGTRRVVEIACAMAHEPSVLLLDEPSSGIAQRESEALAELLHQLKDTTNAAFVIIEHDMPLVTQLSDRIICMHLGTPISEGSAAEVLADPAVVASYLGNNIATIQRSGEVAHR
jgi:ABC-type branched-subunit amino acid transport system ATPase component/ABC-type branched-subunit amino acid transport system permease subunit